MNAHVLKGGCRCGLVAFAVEDGFSYAQICHCSQCRRATGSGSKTFGGIETGRLRVLAGEDALFRYRTGHAIDVRCGRCGSFLWSVVRADAWLHVAYGSLADAPSLAPTDHIFADDAPAWAPILDDLPRHPRYA